MKKANDTKKHKAAYESDYVTYRVLNVFGGCILLMVFAAYLKNGLSYASSFPTAYRVCRAGLWVGLALVLVGAVLDVYQIRKKTYNVKTLFNGTGLMMLGALLALCSYLMVGFDPETALRVLYVIIPVCAILYLVYSVYPREFFSLAAAMTLVALMLWLIAKSTGSNTMSGATVWFLAFGLLICVGLEGLFLLARKNRGKLKVGPVDLSMFSPNTRHELVVTVAACCAVLLLAAFFLAGSIGYYAMFAVVGALFVMAVYYTVKMM